VWLRAPSQSLEAKKNFRVAVERQLHRGNTDHQVLFGNETPIVVNIIFMVKTPMDHFVNRDREHGRLKPNSASKWPSKPDINNLDKFMLDSLQGCIFENDSQVAKQQILKMYDHRPPFNGRTKVLARKATADDFADFAGIDAAFNNWHNADCSSCTK